MNFSMAIVYFLSFQTTTSSVTHHPWVRQSQGIVLLKDQLCRSRPESAAVERATFSCSLRSGQQC